MKRFQSIAFIAFFFITATGAAQDIFYFKKGLFLASGGRYGREAIYTDPLAYRLYTHTLQTPVDGASVQNDNGEPTKWQAISADSANRLFLRSAGRRGFGRSGYIYLTYTSDKERVALLNIRGTN
ncbi:MAG TPA: hypothetical protein VFS22_03615, partial [Flavisolibacter sp.]|nr:hypothetical protein [Flavisolibacter sp.]